MGEEKRTLSCTDCGVLNCHKRNASYPEFCLTEKLTDEGIAETTALQQDEENRKAVYAQEIKYFMPLEPLVFFNKLVIVGGGIKVIPYHQRHSKRCKR